jgi:hypothetical protein
MLVKPQFELQPGQVGKGGLVKDPALYAVVEQRIRAACAELGLAGARLVRQPHHRGRRQPRIFFMCTAMLPSHVVQRPERRGRYGDEHTRRAHEVDNHLACEF